MRSRSAEGLIRLEKRTLAFNVCAATSWQTIAMLAVSCGPCRRRGGDRILSARAIARGGGSQERMITDDPEAPYSNQPAAIYIRSRVDDEGNQQGDHFRSSQQG